MSYIIELLAYILALVEDGDRPAGVTLEDLDGTPHDHGITYDSDEFGEFMVVGFSFPEIENYGSVFAEIEDGTYGELQGIRVYLPEEK